MKIRSGDLGVEAANSEERALSARILLMATTIVSLSLGYFIYADAQGSKVPSLTVPASIDVSPDNSQD